MQAGGLGEASLQARWVQARLRHLTREACPPGLLARPRRPCHGECPRACIGRWRGRCAGHGRTWQGRRAIQGGAGQCRGQAGRVRQGAGQAVVRAGRRATVAAGNAHGNRLRRCRQGLVVDVVVGTWRRAGIRRAGKGARDKCKTGQRQADEQTFFHVRRRRCRQALVAACFAARA